MPTRHSKGKNNVAIRRSTWLVLTASVFNLYLGDAALAATSTLQSGKYEALMLAVTPEHQVEGYYSEQMGEGVSRSCTFYLQGKVEAGRKAALVTWLDASYPGSLEATATGVNLTIGKGQQHPGCISVMTPEIATGLELTRTASKKWVILVTVTADKAYLQKAPDAKAGHRAYLVKDDVVGVLGFNKGWAQVEFINDKDRSFSGWISQDQYAKLTPKQ